MITAGNVRNMVSSIQERYRFQPDDRVAQVSEVSFDNSVLDLFSAWESGAALYVVPENQLWGPLRFLQENEITVWYSVPSFAVFMQKMKMLRPGCVANAGRYSAFAGEALPLTTAEALVSCRRKQHRRLPLRADRNRGCMYRRPFFSWPHVTPGRGIFPSVSRFREWTP